jgi:sacsin
MVSCDPHLCFNEPEVQRVPTQGYTNYSHPLILFTISKQLGVNTKRQEVSKQYVQQSFIPGQ